ncbi:hypothetical protein KKE06_05655 [Candidatus Micrarchaeota archaeon]|nr:hypothetical protein [Candidatus Micrarchaeota archaeon]MBU1930022.1 hypothetical protein [Candidatus Micrarchaeota archaeon]
MQLGKLSFPVQFSEVDVRELVKGLIEEQGWEEYEIQKPELWFFPYWVFNYNSFSEQVDEAGVKSTQEGEQGIIAMHGKSSELEDTVGDLFSSFENDLLTKPIVEHFKAVRFRIRRQEAEKLTRLKIAARLSIDPEFVVISGLKQVFVPVWKTNASFDGQEMEFMVNGVEGNILSDEAVPDRGKTAGELAGETVSDLKKPGNWIRYLVSLIGSIIGFFWHVGVGEGERKGILHNRGVRLLILLIIVILILLNETGTLVLWG